MRSETLSATMALVCGVLAAAAPATAQSAPPIAAHRAWWQAFTLADTAYVRAHSSPSLTLTMSSGTSFDLAATIDEAATHAGGTGLTLDWTHEALRFASPGTAVITSRMVESQGPTSSTYRFLTVLVRAGRSWRVLAAQSTRESGATPRVPLAVAGPLADYGGEYRTPSGRTLRVLARDSALMLIEPSGAELPLEPIGPALFEVASRSPSNAIVRFSFVRDETGRVTSFNRLAPGYVNSIPRVR